MVACFSDAPADAAWTAGADVDCDLGKAVGMELSERLWRELVAPQIEREIPGVTSRVAVGRVGEGSECGGTDDVLSRDHDWGAGLCLWVSDDVVSASERERMGAHVARLVAQAQMTCDYPVLPFAGPRLGIFETGEFYRRFIGLNHVPASMDEWLATPVYGLAVAVNGRVFSDGPGRFTDFRNALTDECPQDIFLRRMSIDAFGAGQAGQYNLLRALKRGNVPTAELMRSSFLVCALRLLFSLNGRHYPFNKWLYQKAGQLPGAHPLCLRIGQLAKVHLDEDDALLRCADLVDEICEALLVAFECHGLPRANDGFLVSEAEGLHETIGDATVASLPYMMAR